MTVGTRGEETGPVSSRFTVGPVSPHPLARSLRFLLRRGASVLTVLGVGLNLLQTGLVASSSQLSLFYGRSVAAAVDLPDRALPHFVAARPTAPGGGGGALA